MTKTNYVELAIEKALNQGYFLKAIDIKVRYELSLPTAKETVAYKEMSNEFLLNKALLDPAFWQALGKSLGWDDGQITSEEYNKAPTDMWMWHFQWHRFIDHLATGRDPNSFFDDLLGNK